MTGKYSKVLLLLSIFLISVAIRIPNLNRPLSKHHEFVTAVSLRVLQIWDQGGASNYYFAPVMNYPGAANKFINNHASPSDEVVDVEGNYYYLSHPPFAYMLPHAVFWLTSIKPTVLSLQIFHLFINFLTALMIYGLARKLVSDNNDGRKVSLWAYVLYVFASAVLWFQSNTYMSDMLVHFFFVAGVYLYISKAFLSGNKGKLLFGLNVFLMVYTSWLGVIFGAVIGIRHLFRKERNLALVGVSTLAVVSALSLTVWQYAQINGVDALLDHLNQRLQVRGSSSIESNDGFLYTKLVEIGTVLFNYAVNYFPLILFIVAGIVFGLRTGLRNSEIGKRFLWSSVIPVIVLHVSLLNYSGHDFTVLYLSVFLSISAALILIKIAPKNHVIFGLILTLFSIGGYFFINQPGEVSWKGDRYDTSRKIGLKIKNESEPNCKVYVLTKEVDPMSIVYAGRNVISVGSIEEIPSKPGNKSVKDYTVIDLDN